MALGHRLGAAVSPGDCILLRGELGAGKTTLAKGIAQGLGVTDYVHSPTFVIVHRYAGRLPMFHIDLYRTEGLLEAHDLAIDEMLEQGVVAAEWPERAIEAFPAEHLELALSFDNDPETRLVAAAATDARHRRLADAIGTRV